MESSSVECSLIKIYAGETKNPSPTIGATFPSDGGLIEIRIRMWYQLCIKAYDFEQPIGDVKTPVFVDHFSMPLAFLLPGLSVYHVSNMLRSINVDTRACEILSPKIAEYAVGVAKRRGPTEAGRVTTVAEVEIKKIAYIREEEFDRIVHKIYGDLI